MPFIISGLALALILIAVVFVVKSLIIICPPNRVACESGECTSGLCGGTLCVSNMQSCP